MQSRLTHALIRASSPVTSESKIHDLEPTQPHRVGARDEQRRTDRDLAGTGQEGDRWAAERRHQQTRELAALVVLDREDVRLGEEPADRVSSEPTHAALDGAVGGVRVDARAGVPALAVDLELGFFCLIAE